MKKLIIALITSAALTVPLLTHVTPVSAARLNAEKYYQTNDCQDGVIEYVLPDRTRIDCLTPEYAIEHDFADKWYQCITQSLYYAMFTGTKASCALIIESESDEKYFTRAKRLIDHYGLSVRLYKVYP